MCAQDAIRQLFSVDSSESSVRLQVCNVMCLLVTTIHQVYAVFYAGSGDPNQPPGMSLQSLDFSYVLYSFQMMEVFSYIFY